ncbi:MAG: hypothetical protein LBU90_06970 [Bacteroidales bacterium]|jgi:hypothetical protein|nr:hypothetical protein [Bacteroidales bacterium]
MKKKTVVLGICSLLSISLFAQRSERTTGYQGSVNVGVATFFSPTEAPSLLTADFVNGYKFSNAYSMGIGVGVRLSHENLGGTAHYLLPLYGNFRANFVTDTVYKIFPYMQTKLGIAIVPYSDTYALLQQSFGVSFTGTPLSVGICGELYAHEGISLVSLGLQLGISF